MTRPNITFERLLALAHAENREAVEELARREGLGDFLNFGWEVVEDEEFDDEVTDEERLVLGCETRAANWRDEMLPARG